MKRGEAAVGLLVIATLAASACGKKGPPLPPLVRLPVAPVEFKAARRGDEVAVQFVVPSANTDGSTPADVARIDVYALTGPSTLTPGEILRRGTHVGSVVVNPPPDPEASSEETARSEKAKPQGGVDQGSVTHLTDPLHTDPAADTAVVRAYLAVGSNKRGRRGAFSQRALVPLGPAPGAPAQPTVTFDEKSIRVTWPVAESQEGEGALPAATYEVYLAGEDGQRLNDAPLTAGSFDDRRIVWGAERCYVVRALGSEQGLTVESDASPPTCVRPVDTFPPKAPVGLNVIAAAGAMNLIWDPNDDVDLAGYIVLRAIAPETEPAPVNTTPITVATFQDTVPAGARVTYGVKAVDKAGNASAISALVEEIAR